MLISTYLGLPKLCATVVINLPSFSECRKNVGNPGNTVGWTKEIATYTACQDFCKDQYSTAQYIGYFAEAYKWLPKGLCMCKSALDESNKLDIEGYVGGTVNCVVAGK